MEPDVLDAREQRIRDLLPLVKRLARRVRRMIPTADLDDLIGDGSIGLLRAVDAFDAGFGTSLEHYARRIIVGTMLNGIRRLDPVSERVRRTMRTADAQRHALAQERGEKPTWTEMERKVPGLRRARGEMYRCTPLSLDVPLPLNEHLAADMSADPQRVYLRRMASARVNDAIDALPPRQRTIVLAHYYRDRSLRSLSSPLGISAQRVSQLHILAVTALRSQLAAAP